MSIGRFARRTGLSIGALRHYAAIDLLIPARIDPETGYRYYTADQIPAARRIAELRYLDVPIALIRQVRDATPEELARRLAAYRAEIEASIWKLQRQAHRLAYYEPKQENEMASTPFTLDRDDERRLASTLFNGVWDLLEKADRTDAESETMLHAAHASRHHWGVIGEPRNWAIGEWQVSRVYAVLGRSEPALHHGRRSLALAEEHQLGPFLLGYGHEAIARGYRVAGDASECARHVKLADAVVEKITDAEERELLVADLDQIR
jgi:DNA-binding transcriptional MerR regulator